jgi:hypothetical protein
MPGFLPHAPAANPAHYRVPAVSIAAPRNLTIVQADVTAGSAGASIKSCGGGPPLNFFS